MRMVLSHVQAVEEMSEQSEDSDTSEAPDDSSEEDETQGTSEMQTVFNIVKNIVGEGMLSLPAGVAAGTGLFIGMMITTLFGALLGYTFSVMGRVCYGTGKASHKECAAAVSGPVLAEGMAAVCMLKTASSCLSYAIVISESLSRILEFFEFVGWYSSRQSCLIIIMIAVLLPLCLQQDLACLSYTSLFGIVCEVFVVVFMSWRWADGSYQEGGAFYDSTEPIDRPFGKVLKWPVTMTTFILLSSLSTAFIAHYNAPKFYSRMRNKSPAKFNRVVAVSFLTSIGIYVWVMAVGYATFRESCEGLILNNYSNKDPGAVAARLAITAAVIFAFPLAFIGLRDSTLAVAGMPEKRRFFASVTIGLLAFISVVAFFVHDLGFVNSFGGSIFGSLIVLIFPAVLLVLTDRNLKMQAVFSAREVKASVLLLGVGFVIMFLGATVSVCQRFFPKVLS